MTSEPGVDRSGLPEEYLPEWEVAIRAYGPDDEPAEARHDHFHPRGVDEEEAKEKAIGRASGLGGLIGSRDSYDVLEVAGPFDVPEVPESVRRAARADDEQARLTEVSD